MNLIIAIFYRCLSNSEKGVKNSGLNGDSNPDLCDTCAVLHQLSNQANWEQVVMWVDYKPLDVEIDDDNTGISHVHFLPICSSNTWKIPILSSSISTSKGL